MPTFTIILLLSLLAWRFVAREVEAAPEVVRVSETSAFHYGARVNKRRDPTAFC